MSKCNRAETVWGTVRSDEWRRDHANKVSSPSFGKAGLKLAHIRVLPAKGGAELKLMDRGSASEPEAMRAMVAAVCGGMEW